MPKRLILVAAVALSAGSASAQNDEFYGGPPAVPELEPAFEKQFRAPVSRSEIPVETATIASGLVHPWGIDELPDGRIIVTERPGRLRIVGEDGSLSDPIEGVPEVVAQRQGGLLDVTLAPDFDETREVFLTLAHPLDGGENTAAVAKGRLAEDDSRLEDVEIIFEQVPGYSNNMHYGSRIVFEDDDTLFVGLGERSDRETRVLSQDLSTHYGKVVRIGRDGSPAEDNPFVGDDDAQPEIWSYGHRNIQAATLNEETGELWLVEHGPQGGDELNIPEAGKNYGWPVVTYGENYGGGAIGEGVADGEGFEQPAYYWSPVIAPSGMAFYDGEMFPEWQGNLLVGGLIAQAVVRLELDGKRVQGEDRVAQGVGRVRDVMVASDGSIVLAIDAAEGRLVRLTRGD